MKRSSIIWILIIAIIVVAGAWYWSAGPGNSANVSTLTPPSASSSASLPPAAGTVVLGTANTGTLGTYLVASNGLTLYQYSKDQPDKSVCTGQCATIWPPYTVSANEASSTSAPLIGDSGATGSIGTITRANGTLQITYNNIPLYFYAKDKAPGDATGQGVEGSWFVIDPSIMAAPGATSSTSSAASSSSQTIAGPGGHCGGNTVHPATCGAGYHCAPNPSSTLPFGDVGGICVASTTTTPAAL